jgi:hypothetical protein
MSVQVMGLGFLFPPVSLHILAMNHCREAICLSFSLVWKGPAVLNQEGSVSVRVESKAPRGLIPELLALPCDCGAAKRCPSKN